VLELAKGTVPAVGIQGGKGKRLVVTGCPAPAKSVLILAIDAIYVIDAIGAIDAMVFRFVH
jgi:hypothetical protein